MIETMVRNWWIFVLRGGLAILFGVLAFAQPNITLAVLVALFGAYALVDGVMECIVAPTLYGTRYFWWLLISGILGIAAGVITFMHPNAVAASLFYLLAFWLIFAGIFRTIVAFQIRNDISDEWLLILSGILSVAAGVLMFYRPGPSLLAWIWVIGAYAILYGCLLIAGGFRLRKWENKTTGYNTLANS